MQFFALIFEAFVTVFIKAAYTIYEILAGYSNVNLLIFLR